MSGGQVVGWETAYRSYNHDRLYNSRSILEERAQAVSIVPTPGQSFKLVAHGPDLAQQIYLLGLHSVLNNVELLANI